MAIVDAVSDANLRLTGEVEELIGTEVTKQDVEI